VDRLESLLRRSGFAAFVLTVAVWVQVDLLIHDSTWDPVLAGAALLVPLPLLARRRAPLVAPVLVLLGLVLLAARAPDVTYDAAAPFFALLLTSFVVAQQSDARLAIAGLGAVVATAAYVAARFPEETVGDFLWRSLFATAIWLTGFVVDQRAREAAGERDRARHFEEQALRAVDEERQRLARELHDVVAHSVSVMTVQAGGVRRLLRPEQEREREALQAIEDTGRQALVEMRRMLGVLRGADVAGVAPLAPQPGMGSLAVLIAEMREAGLPVEYRVKGEPARLPPGIDLSAYRIVQEALASALGDGGSARAKVEVRWSRDLLELEITDEGRAAPGANGGGLAAMRERVALCGGRLDDGPRPGGGYLVRARLPISEDGAE
jgi:signal transduction histidine kinase